MWWYKMDFDSRFASYCVTNDFKKFVRQSVSDEIFWRDYLSSVATRDLLSQIPEKVQSETNRLVPPMINRELETFSRVQIPSHVARALAEQLPGFLNNNAQMQQILHHHSLNLNQQLTDAAHIVLEQVVNEDQYHIMTNRLSAAITQKSEENLTRVNNDANRRLAANDEAFQTALTEMRRQVNNQVEALAEANRRSDEQSSQIKTLQTELSSLRWMVGILSGSAIVVAAVGFFRCL